MPETTGNFHHIPVAECEITATIDISKEHGIKARYCGKEKKIHTYLFDADRWTMDAAKGWVRNHSRQAEAETLGRMEGPEAGGPGGECVCPGCGREIEHETAEPCSEVKCPECGATMTRRPEGSDGEVAENGLPILNISLLSARGIADGSLKRRIVSVHEQTWPVLEPVLISHGESIYAKVILTMPIPVGDGISSYEVRVLEAYDPPIEATGEGEKMLAGEEGNDFHAAVEDVEESLLLDTDLDTDAQQLSERVSWRLPPFSNEGGSYFLAPKIRDALPMCNTYCEPYAGSSSVLFSRYSVPIEVLNDTDEELIQAYEDIRALTLRQLIELRRKNWHPWETKFRSLKEYMADDEVNRLYRFLYLSWFSFNEDRRTYRGRPKNFDLEARLGRVENARVRLREVKLTSEDGIACIEGWDGPTTAFFIDPPFSETDNLIETIRNLQGKFVLRAEDTKQNRELFSLYRLTSSEVAKRAGRESAWEDGKVTKVRSELLVTNCEA